ncbi:MAG: histidine triad nucleotide-binding protein [Thermoanaerobaculia bacterium]
MDPDCLFCRIVSGKLPAPLLYSDDDIVAFADIAPQAPLHCLVVPRAHLPHLFATNASDALVLGKMVATGTELARRAGLEKDGFRLVWNCLAGAGQSVFHLHLHVLGGRPFSWPPG